MGLRIIRLSSPRLKRGSAKPAHAKGSPATAPQARRDLKEIQASGQATAFLVDQLTRLLASGKTDAEFVRAIRDLVSKNAGSRRRGECPQPQGRLMPLAAFLAALGFIAALIVYI
jgi:hypothetical protein